MEEAGSPKEKGFGTIPIAISVVATLISLAAMGLVLTAPRSHAPVTQEFTIIMGEGEIIGCVNETTGQVVIEETDPNCEEEIVGEFHRWEPALIVVRKGDTVELTVKNPRSNNHGLSIPDFGVDTGKILGKKDSPPTGSETTVTFVADESGVFQFRCSVPHDHDTNDCDEDHVRMVGYIIVLE